MNLKLQIQADSLKDLLSLFDANDELSELELGDTWHPSSGFVDEDILGGRRLVSDILSFDYDFRGLVQFDCIIRTMKVELLNTGAPVVFGFSGGAKHIRCLKDRTIERNALRPGQYKVGKLSL